MTTPQLSKNPMPSVSQMKCEISSIDEKTVKCEISLIDQILKRLQEITTTSYPVYFQMGKKPSPSQIAKTKTIVLKAKNLLNEKASVEDISTQFLLLTGGMKTTNVGDDKAAAAAYLIALESFSPWAIRQSVKDILQGKAKGMSKTFMPAAPELGAYCNQIEQTMKTKVNAVERLLNAEEEKPTRITHDETSSARINALMAEFNAQK